MDIKKHIEAIERDEQRNSDFLHLTSNENQMSETARKFLGSKLSERYFFGAGENNVVDFGAYTCLGMESVAGLVGDAEKAAKEMLGAEFVNFNLLSGVHAMMCSILSTTEPGDTVMSIHHDHGGHFATQGILARIGRKNILSSFDADNLRFDAKKMGEDFKKAGAKALYMDVSYYLNPHNLREIREALGPDAVIIYDASHTMGLILSGEFQDPFAEGADVISANTHKTLPGPQKGMIAFKDKKIGEKANAIIDGSLYSSPHTHHLIALATTILELKEFGPDYAKQIIANSNAFGEAFIELGYEARKANTGRISENHQVHLFTDRIGERLDLYQNLYRNGIAVNFDDPIGDRVYIRFGTHEATRRGMKEDDMKTIASFVDRSFKGEDIKSEVSAFNKKFSKIHYSFD